MPIINRSSQLYSGASGAADASFVIELELGGDFQPEAYSEFADAEFDGVIDLLGDFAGEAYNPFVDAELDGAIELDGDFAATAANTNGLDFNVELASDFECDTVLALQEPEPITNSIAAGAFTVQRYPTGGGRLYINDVLAPFVSAEINAPAKSLGKSLKIELAKADLAQLPDGATFKFQIGKVVAGITIWHTILDGGFLEGRSFSMAFGRNNLNFSTTAGTEKLGICPKNNLIVYDPSKAEVSTEEIESIPTNTSEVITTTKQAVNVLTLYKLLNIAFVTGCGFNSVTTDVPNYEIARCDFSVAQSYAASVAQFIGVYEPEFSIDADDNLTIQKTINPLPEDFTPAALTVLKMPNFTETAEYPASGIDGYTLIYTGTGGAFYIDRTETPIVEQIGEAEFGSPDFVEQITARKFIDWFENGNPVAVRTELKQETIETRRAGVTVGIETKLNKFDALGRSKGYTNTLEARLPDVANEGAPALLKTKEDSQKITTGINPFAPRQTIIKKIETTKKSLLAIDSENTALDSDGNDSPYGQDYEKVFEAGNLKTGMTSSFAILETAVERFRPLPNGQIEVRVEQFDYLRGKPKPPIVDVRSGDISVQNFQKQKIKTIFKDGITQATRTGKPLPSLNAGELPLFFAEPLADWLLANGRITANIELGGYDESVERGVSFNLRGCTDEDLGNFLVSGYRVRIEPSKIMTNLDALKV